MDQDLNHSKPPQEENAEPFMRTFSSQEEAELFRLKRDMDRTDMEKFRLFCRMLRIGRMLSSASVSGNHH
jgi:hypothetical protein